MRIAAGIAYRGDHFHGWQRQPVHRSVQQVLERALSQMAAEPVATLCAGRTDAGVHATAQVIHFDTSAARPMQAWVRGTNALLPPDVSVQWARPVDPGFHARFSAQARSYRYLLLRTAVRQPLWHGLAAWVFDRPDVGAMRAAAAVLAGRHDFSSFRSSECQARSPVRTLQPLRLEEAGDFVVMRFEADGFLHHMVRNIVGALVEIGRGRRPVSWMQALLEARDRRQGAPTFAAAGLYLAGVRYPAAFGLEATGASCPAPWPAIIPAGCVDAPAGPGAPLAAAGDDPD